MPIHESFVARRSISRRNFMIDELPIQYWSSETERNAYNAAFYELGFRWHWDRETYCQLLRQSQDGIERVSHYLNAYQPHLLRAYDAKFLAEVIEQKKQEHQKREPDTGAMKKRYFNWAESRGAELGA
ncbi:hypothetical protein [Variovorax sp. AFSI2.2]|uniref:hypothetical protein n=1 Tax=Variovorax sp. AFSI2.2 TaxID=3384160 RepID=UPI003EB9B105